MNQAGSIANKNGSGMSEMFLKSIVGLEEGDIGDEGVKNPFMQAFQDTGSANVNGESSFFCCTPMSS